MTRLSIPEPWRGRALVIGDAVFSDGWFSASELEQSASLHLHKRRTEWKHGRLAVKQLAIDLGLCLSARDCEFDRPRLVVRGQDVKRFVSISHSAGYAAAAIDISPVGIDCEVVRDLRPDASRFFLTEEEADSMRRCNIDHRLIHFWAAKEAVWKQRDGRIASLKQTPILFEAEWAGGLRFREVETCTTGPLVVALTRPISEEGSWPR